MLGPMSIRHLDALFDPASVAVFGASERPASVGATVWSNLRTSGFRGALFAVNPKHRTLGGVPVYAGVADLPQAPELAVICTPPATVPALIAELGARGTHAAIVLTAGLDAAQKQAMLDAARPHLLRILGPNCIGLLAPHVGLNASFSHVNAQPGELAFVSQSGALVTAMLDWARGRGIGFSQFVSLGEHADVDFGDMLDYLASDARTRAILLYIESIESTPKFMSAARAAARNKPVIVIKAGRSAQGQKAAASHTGALAGSDWVYDAAIRRAGMLRVDTLQQLFMAAETLSRFRGSTAQSLAILTNGGGAGVMAADAAAHASLPLAELSETTMTALNAALPANWSRGNPVDIIGDAPVARYEKAWDALEADPAAPAVLFIHAPTAIVPSAQIAQALAQRAGRVAGDAAARHKPTRMLACWLGDAAVAEAQSIFQNAGIACYPTPEDAVRAFAMLVEYRRNQAQLMETPPAALPAAPGAVQTEAGGSEAARQVIKTALAAGREWLTEPEAKAVLAAYRIPVVATRSVPADAEAAVQAAQAIGGTVVLKILSPDITHKTDVGGVALGLNGAKAVRDAALTMLARVRSAKPQARLEGFTVQAMVDRAQAQELIVGANLDPVFGPVILCGQGGTAVEVLADRAIGLPPLNVPLARALVDRTRVARLLAGFRDTPPADREALHAVLVAVSQLLAEQDAVTELDINPLIVGPRRIDGPDGISGAVALDARVRISPRRPGGARAFAIRPYPQEQVEHVVWNGQALTLRPIKPEDEAQHLIFLSRLDPEDIRLRVFYSRRSIAHSELARLTQIDYARETAFVAVVAGTDGVEETLGVARALCDPDNIEAEFGIIVRSDLKGGGLGELLMRKLIRTLRAQGTQRLVATVLQDNRSMLDLAQRLGFAPSPDQPDDGTRAIVLNLDGATG